MDYNNKNKLTMNDICDKNFIFRNENVKAVFCVIDKDKKGYSTSNDIQRFFLGNKKVK